MSASTPATESFQELASRVDQLRNKVTQQSKEVHALLDETIDAITAFNRAGLAELVRVLRADARGTELLFEAVDIAEVMALMVSHGIVRADLTLDVLRIVDQLRPHLMAASVNLEVVRVEGDVVFIRYNGHRPDDELDQGVRETLLTRVPGLARVQEESAEPSAAFVSLPRRKVRPS